MKKLVPSILIGLLLATVGFFIGRETGFADGYKSCEINYKYKDADEIREDIKTIERKNIVAFLRAKAGIVSKKEGPVFNKHREVYLSGIINNNATWSNCGNITLKIDFFSDDRQIIGSDTIQITDSITPGSLIKFNEKISSPENFESFEFMILDAEAS
jgi:hypothetical protein